MIKVERSARESTLLLDVLLASLTLGCLVEARLLALLARPFTFGAGGENGPRDGGEAGHASYPLAP